MDTTNDQVIEKKVIENELYFFLPPQFSDFDYFDSFIQHIVQKYDAIILEKIEIADVYAYQLKIDDQIVEASSGDTFFMYLRNRTAVNGGILNVIVPELNQLIQNK